MAHPGRSAGLVLRPASRFVIAHIPVFRQTVSHFVEALRLLCYRGADKKGRCYEISIATVLLMGGFFCGTAVAVDGRNAVGVCIDVGPKCAWSVNDKGEVDVCTANGCWYCPSATSECVPARTTRPKPSNPVRGTIVSTKIGWYEVGKNPGIDKLIPPAKKP